MLHDRSSPHGVLPSAGSAPPQEPLAPLTRSVIHLVDIGGFAMRTGRITSPAVFLQEGHGLCLVGKDSRNLPNDVGLPQFRMYLLAPSHVPNVHGVLVRNLTQALSEGHNSRKSESIAAWPQTFGQAGLPPCFFGSSAQTCGRR
jgi:hypothetical protein